MIALPDRVPELRQDLEDAADSAKAEPMAAYMKDRFDFLGVPSPIRKVLQRPVINAVKHATEAELLEFAELCWDEPEREFQYIACDALRRGSTKLSPTALPKLRNLIETKPWWDTVDTLASNTIGPLVANHAELSKDMDNWILSDHIWVARTAILHQLKYKQNTDADRLFSYCATQAISTEFFIRKALGWALREYAKTNPQAVQSFVGDNVATLSGLTRREALKNLA